MAYDIALNIATHDLLLQDGDNMLIDNAERVAQQIKIKLKWFLGEWFLNTADGLPYFEDILVKNPNMTRIRNIFRQKILEVDDVKAVNSLTLSNNRQTRELTVEYEAATDYGLVTNREVLGYGNN